MGKGFALVRREWGRKPFEQEVQLPALASETPSSLGSSSAVPISHREAGKVRWNHEGWATNAGPGCVLLDSVAKKPSWRDERVGGKGRSLVFPPPLLLPILNWYT